jgi:hypothetical protein
MDVHSRRRRARGALTAFAGALWAALSGSHNAEAQTSPPERALISTLFASGPHSSRTEEARLFDSFVGAWDCEYTFLAADGTVRRAIGDVTFGWIIDGRAIQDTWISYPDGRDGRDRNIGTTIRFFDDSARTWRIVFVSPQFRAITTLEGGKEGDRIVLRGRDGDGTLLRWTFNDILRDSFLWRGETSRDGGTTWRLEEEHRMSRRAQR